MIFRDTLLTKLGQLLLNVHQLTGTVYRNGVLTTLAVDIENLNTGVYSYSFELPSDWLAPDQVSVHFEYVMNNFPPVTTKIRLGTVSDVAAIIASPEVSTQISASLVEATQEELHKLATEIAANSLAALAEMAPETRASVAKKLTASGHIAKITGVKTL